MCQRSLHQVEVEVDQNQAARTVEIHVSVSLDVQLVKHVMVMAVHAVVVVSPTVI